MKPTRTAIAALGGMTLGFAALFLLRLHGPAIPSSADAAAADGWIPVTSVRVGDLGWKPTVPVTIAGKRLDYLLDTGGERMSLAPAHAVHLHGRAESMIADVNGSRRVFTGMIPELFVGQHRLASVEAMILGEYVDPRQDLIRFQVDDAVVGQSILGRGVVILDGPAGRLRLDAEPPTGDTVAFHSFGRDSRHLLVKAIRGDRDVTVFLDTGFSGSRFAARAPGAGRMLLLGGVTIDLGGHGDSVKMVEAERQMVVTVDGHDIVIHGTLGWDILRHYTQVIDYPNSRLLLQVREEDKHLPGRRPRARVTTHGVDVAVHTAFLTRAAVSAFGMEPCMP